MATFDIPKIKFGNDSLPEIGLGAMGMSFGYGGRDEKESVKVLNKALDLVPKIYIDTSDIYGTPKDGDLGFHQNETLIGQALNKRRDEVFIGTKFGFTRSSDGNISGVDGSRDRVRSQIEGSLKALQTDHVDLYYQHRVDPKTPIEETVKAMAELVKEGKVKYLGLSECSAATLRKANAVHPITAIQIEYSLWTPDIETNGIIDACRELGIVVVAYSPLGRGFLTGAYKSPDDFDADDGRRHQPRFSKENFPKNLELVDKVHAIAKAKGCTASQLAVAWTIAKGKRLGVTVVPIPGTKKEKYLLENLGAAKVQLSDADLDEIQKLLDGFQASGTRYPEAMMKALGH